MATDLAECLLLELTDALAGQIVLVADLLERELVLVVQAEAPAEDASFHGREGLEQTADFAIPALALEALVRGEV